MERIQKILSAVGYCSRRQAEKLIAQGLVSVNGKTAVLGDKASQKDIITVGNDTVKQPKNKRLTYVMLNKPRGYVTTTADEKGRKTVMDLVPSGLYPVGRLDMNTEGLLLFTNDGTFANEITHPSKEISKTYRVTVKSGVTEEQLTELSCGIMLDDKMTLPATVNVEVNTKERSVMLFTIREGRNRQIRRMCDKVGLEVARLKRISIGPLKLGMLKPSTCRELSKEELRAIRNAIS
jgi:23S rRNA pseudouridine2605 synthase